MNSTLLQSLRAACCLCVLAGPAALAGEIYRWQGADGEVHFGDKPPASGIATRVEVQPTPTTPGMAPAAAEHGNAPAPAPRLAADRRESCDQARWALAALESGRPVYRDERGAFRVKRPPGHPDVYAGPRDYLADAQRGAEIAQQQEALTRDCAAYPELMDKQRSAEDLSRAENCEAAMARWDEISRPDSTAGDTAREQTQRDLKQWCEPGSPPP